MLAGKPLLTASKRAASVLSSANSKRSKVASEAHHDQVEARCSMDIEDSAWFTTTEIKQVVPVLQTIPTLAACAHCSVQTLRIAVAPAWSVLAHKQQS